MIAVTLLQPFKVRFVHFFFGILIALTSVLSAKAQSQESPKKLNMVFKGFIQSGSPVPKGTLDVLNERMRTELVGLQKFNIIQRDNEMWKRIEEELKIQDFIDAKTAVNLGNMLGANYYIEGKLAALKTERKEEKSTSGKDITVTYTTTGEASLNLINLETGKYDIAVYSTKVNTSGERQNSIEVVIREMVADLINRLGKKFLLEATIQSVNGQEAIVISKGFEDGVKQQHTYNLATDKAVKFKITQLSEHSATGRLMQGDFGKLTPGSKVIEAEVGAKNVINVKHKDRQKVYVDGGTNLGIKKGDTYVAKEDKAIDLGSRTIYESTVKGSVYITEVYEDYSQGKIIDGYRNFSSGMTIFQPQKEVDTDAGGVALGYKMGFIKPVQANTDHGEVQVSNSIGNYDIDTDYNRRFEDIETVSVYSVGLVNHYLVKDLATSVNVDVYDIGGGKLRNWIFNIDLTYNHTFSPERLFGVVGGGLGYGRLKQDVPDGTVQEISEGTSSELKAHSLYATAIVGLKLRIKRFSFMATASYDYLRFKNWKYDYKNSKDESKTGQAPSDIIPYPDVNLSGVYFKGTLSYTLF